MREANRQQIFLRRARPPIGDWVQQAACRGMDPEIFYPEQGETPSEALKVCATCPVKAECGMHALMAEERIGVWGMMTARERRDRTREKRLAG